MSKTELRRKSLEHRINILERQVDRILRELESIETRVERLERLPHNRPKDILTY
ncbi:MAG: hypothetical protein QXW77_03365 [Candidatus Hadarchaeales archaeon]